MFGWTWKKYTTPNRTKKKCAFISIFKRWNISQLMIKETKRFIFTKFPRNSQWYNRWWREHIKIACVCVDVLKHEKWNRKNSEHTIRNHMQMQNKVYYVQYVCMRGFKHCFVRSFVSNNCLYNGTERTYPKCLFIYLKWAHHSSRFHQNYSGFYVGTCV